MMLNPQQLSISQLAEQEEQKLISKGYTPSAISFDPTTGMISMGDARDYIERQDGLMNVSQFDKAKIAGAAGKSIDDYKIFSDLYQTMVEDHQTVMKLIEDNAYTWHGIAGAAGPEAVSNYETVKRAGELLGQVTGQMHNTEEYQAMNIAAQTSSNLKGEFIRKSGVPFDVFTEMPNDVSPGDARQSYVVDEKEMFADGIAFSVFSRDLLNNKVNILEQFRKDLPGAFLKAKNNKVLSIINAIPGTNQGDWDAVTGNKYTVRAATQIQVAEDYVKKYGLPAVCVMNSDTWRLYVDNLDSAYLGFVPSNVSTSGADMKQQTLAANPGIQVFIDDGLTSQSYVLASLNSYMKRRQGPVIQSEVDSKGTPGQAKRRFYFDFNDVVVTEPDAVFRGITVGV